MKSTSPRTIAISLAVALSLPLFAESPQRRGYDWADEEGGAGGLSGTSGVYAKIILPMGETADGAHPPVESWIATKLRKRGEAELRAVTSWVRLAEEGE
jgi:hypothetical protein